MPRNITTGVFTRVSNSFSNPVYGTVIDPTDADALFDDYDGGLTFNDSEPLMLVGSTSGALTILAPDTASGTITLPAGTTDFSATGGAGQFVKQASAGGAFTVSTVPASEVSGGAALTRVNDTNVTLTLAGSPSTSLLAATSITAGWSGQLPLSRGGTNANLTASNGGILYSTASELAILAGTATGGQILRSGSSSAPSWSNAIYPSSTTSQQILYSTATNTVNGLTSANGAIPNWDSSSGVLSATATPALGVNGSYGGGVLLRGSTSGTVTVQPVAAAGTYNFNLPTSAGTSGQPLLSGGGGSTAQSYGTLGVAGGGTGLTSGTSGGVLGFTASGTLASSAALGQYGVVIGGGAGATPTAITAGTNGQLLLGVTGAAPAMATMSGGATITNAGVVTLAQIPDTSGSPSASFGAVKVDGTTITSASGVLTAVGAAATDVAVGTTTVSSGTSGYLLYNNAGTLGNLATSQIPGTTTNDNANAGNIGQYLSIDNGGGVSVTVTISNATPAVVTGAHGITVGGNANATVACYLTTTGTLPTGLSPNTIYYAHVTSSTTLNLSTTAANALAGTYIATSSAGSGTHTLRTTALPLTTDTALTLAAMQMPAGDLDVTGGNTFGGGASTTVGYAVSSIGPTAGSLNQVINFYGKIPSSGSVAPYAASGEYLIYTGTGRLSLASPTNYFLVAQSGFSVSTSQVTSVGMRVRRVR